MGATNPGRPASSKAPTNGKKKINFLDLPAETIGLIFENATNHELALLCRVSKHVRELAAAELYRDLNHTFRHDAFRDQLNIDYLAGYLETLATSDYNYAGHIKEVFVDTAAAGDLGERACREFSYDHTCGKFLNTLLLATLKRTKGLEGFHWNARIELSSSVYQILYRMQNLRRVHIRLQPGPSLHSTSNYVSTSMSIPSPPVTLNVAPAPPGHPPPPLHSHNGFNAPQHVVPPVNIAKKIPVSKQVARPSTFSQFRELKSLRVLDMDTLEYLPEIAECIHHCSESLKYLELSISDRLARKARRVNVADSVSDNTGSDDDLSIINVAPPMPFDFDIGGSGSNTVLPQSNQSHKTSQEHALARVFEYKAPTPQAQELRSAADDVIARADKEMQLELKTSTRDEEDRQFVKMMQSIFREEREKADNDKSSRRYRALDKIERAASKYLESREHSSKFSIHQKGKKKITVVNKKTGVKKTIPPTFIPVHAPGQYIPASPPGPMSNRTASTVSHDPAENLEFDDFLYDINPPAKHAYPPPQQFHNSANQPYPTMPSPGPAAVYKSKSVNMFEFGKEDQMAEMDKTYYDEAKTWGAEDPSYGKLVPGVVYSAPHPEEDQNELENDEIQEVTTVQVTKPTNSPDQEVFDDDIDMEHPDEDCDDGEDQKFGNEVQANGDRDHTDEEDEDVADDSTETVQLSNGVSENAKGTENEPSPKLSETENSKGKQAIRDPPEKSSSQQTKDLKIKSRSSSTLSETSQSSASTYLRLAHGLPLESLSIYLLPVKPSVLLRHIDVHSLKYLCLLNVGPQRTFWATLAKLHRQTPLQLSSIYTDNVTHSFLMFVNGLEEGQIEELFMLEHGPRADVPQLQGCAKTMVETEEIRKMILKKHLKGMKRLMIRNDDEDSWAINPATARLIAKHGSKLRELAIQCGSVVYHSIMRSLPDLRDLWALQITFIVDPVAQPIPMTAAFPPQAHHHHHNHSLPLSASPTILYELRSCCVDNLSHIKDDFNLEYLGLSCVDGNAPSGHGLGPPLVMLSKICTDIEPWTGDESDEDGNANEHGPTSGPKGETSIWTEDNLKMAEVQGLVRIWDKEIWAGRL